MLDGQPAEELCPRSSRAAKAKTIAEMPRVSAATPTQATSRIVLWPKSPAAQKPIRISATLTVRQALSRSLRGEVRRARQPSQLGQALLLELPDSLACDVEGAPQLLERGRRASIQPVAALEDLALATRKRFEKPAQRFVSQDRLDLLVGELVALVREEVTELGLTRLADRRRKRDRRLRVPADLLHLRNRHLQLESDLSRARLPAILRPQLTFRAADPV